jgi:hypothetical protein
MSKALIFALALGASLGPTTPAPSMLAPQRADLGPDLGPEQAPPDASRQLSRAELELQARLAEQSVDLDLAHGYCALPVEVAVREDLLEYLLVGSAGASHESAFTTSVAPSVLNVALLALGVTPGRNADWRRKDPLPSQEELDAGVSPYEVQVPSGDGFYIYIGWRSGDEEFLYRVEDLIRNLASGQAMERSPWVYLGSAQVPRTPKSPPEDSVFAADVYRNLINVAFFREGFTLLTGAREECVEQSIWMLNAWLVPERGSKLTLFLSRERLSGAAPHVRARLPELAPAVGEGR